MVSIINIFEQYFSRTVHIYCGVVSIRTLGQIAVPVIQAVKVCAGNDSRSDGRFIQKCVSALAHGYTAVLHKTIQCDIMRFVRTILRHFFSCNLYNIITVQWLGYKVHRPAVNIFSCIFSCDFRAVFPIAPFFFRQLDSICLSDCRNDIRRISAHIQKLFTL